MIQRIFLYQALVVERPSVKILLGWEWDHIGLQCMHVCTCVCGLKLDRSEKPVLICPKECLWRGANSQRMQLLVAETERERESVLQFYLGGCGKVPSCFMLTGHLSNWNHATAPRLLCHVVWLQLPRYISCWKNWFKHFNRLRFTRFEKYTFWGPSHINLLNLWIYNILLLPICPAVTSGKNSKTKLILKSQNSSYVQTWSNISFYVWFW